MQYGTPYGGPNIVYRSANPGYGNNIISSTPISNKGFRATTVGAQPHPTKKLYLQKTTKNKSFLDMHHYLVATGRKNNAWMLLLYDPDLDGIDPHDPNLNAYYKQKVLRECMVNYIYFLRECVKLPSSGAKPMMYKLNRGNMALTYCQTLNLNVFLELPRLIL